VENRGSTGADLGDQAASEADGDRVRPGARLQLGEQVADVRLHRLLAQEETDSDLPIHEAVRDQLKNFDLAHRGLLLQLAQGASKGDYLCISVLPLGGNSVEPTLVIHVSAQDFFALGGVHIGPIGRMAKPL
jgi:hypothetical protein